MLNEHVLTIDESTLDYAKVVDYAGMGGLSGNGGDYKCAHTGGNPWPTASNPSAGYADPTSTTPNNAWPHGTCCNDGGACSDPAANTDRYVVEFSRAAARNTISEYEIVRKARDCGRDCGRDRGRDRARFLVALSAASVVP